MRKNLILLLVVIITISLNSQVYAQKTDVINKKELDSLQKKGFTKDDMNKMSEETKEKFIKENGEKADYTVEPVEEFYNSLNGKRYKVKKENRWKIEELKKKDFKQMDMTYKPSVPPYDVEGISPFHIGGKWDDDMEIHTFVRRIGSSSNNYDYDIFTEFTWWTDPLQIFNDTVVTAWQNEFTGIAGTEFSEAFGYSFKPDGSYRDQFKLDFEFTPEVYGLKADLGPTFKKEVHGILSQEVRTPKLYEYWFSSMTTAYLHPYLPGNVGVNIGPGNISYDTFWGMEWSYRINVLIGS